MSVLAFSDSDEDTEMYYTAQTQVNTGRHEPDDDAFSAQTQVDPSVRQLSMDDDVFNAQTQVDPGRQSFDDDAFTAQTQVDPGLRRQSTDEQADDDEDTELYYAQTQADIGARRSDDVTASTQADPGVESAGWENPYMAATQVWSKVITLTHDV